jgi:hypothetical protein
MNKHDDQVVDASGDYDPMDELAPGHNPDKLTRRQVETDLGWRLVTLEEKDKAGIAEKYLTQYWSGSDQWMQPPYRTGKFAYDSAYRTQCPKGYFLPRGEQQDTAPNPQKRQFKTGAQRDHDNGKGLPHLIPTRPLDLLARHFQTGAEKYGPNNWQKGIPVSAYYDSAMRHLWAVHRGETNEPHLTACIWNLVCLQDTLQSIAAGALPQDLNDLSFHTET